ncbi:PEPxxWA-CTERM sorting domain-containing protein [Sphingobium boeckii]|uniref:Ice-binding protein C-terminal domain-containing protein n=1 Tax=Sphingobium boeckii TaxID=1082345 RepID=A0A7W9EDU6_9SPHN|nr:PEPxxWA-CTERM sorting domain-containing protein [Sphingobium boeckii]MBB5685487.1 hypothetical protein [Sphingobium boeckii]
MKILKLAAAAALATVSATGHAAVTLTVEAAGVQNTTTAYTGGVATFNTLNGYNENVAVALGGNTATFSRLNASTANVYGGANGSNFITVANDTVIGLSTAVNYFGLWASALDGGNAVEFFSNGASLGSFNLTAFALDSAYAGNPNGGGNAGEKYAFFNFNSDTKFDQVKLIQNGGGGFEVDNVTLGNAVPEPATWAMMLIGFGVVGYAMRRKVSVKTSFA